MQVHSFRDAQFLQWDPEKALKKSYSSNSAKTNTKQVKEITTAVATQTTSESATSSENDAKASQSAISPDTEAAVSALKTVINPRIDVLERSLGDVGPEESFNSSDAIHNEDNGLAGDQREEGISQVTGTFQNCELID